MTRPKPLARAVASGSSLRDAPRRARRGGAAGRIPSHAAPPRRRHRLRIRRGSARACRSPASGARLPVRPAAGRRRCRSRTHGSERAARGRRPAERRRRAARPADGSPDGRHRRAWTRMARCGAAGRWPGAAERGAWPGQPSRGWGSRPGRLRLRIRGARERRLRPAARGSRHPRLRRSGRVPAAEWSPRWSSALAVLEMIAGELPTRLQLIGDDAAHRIGAGARLGGKLEHEPALQLGAGRLRDRACMARATERIPSSRSLRTGRRLRDGGCSSRRATCDWRAMDLTTPKADRRGGLVQALEIVDDVLRGVGRSTATGRGRDFGRALLGIAHRRSRRRGKVCMRASRSAATRRRG